MKESGPLLAGEMSGHIFFADRYFGFDDAIYAGVPPARDPSAKSGKPLAELLADLPTTFTTPEIRVDCPDAHEVRDRRQALKRAFPQGRLRRHRHRRRARQVRATAGAWCARRTRSRCWCCASRRWMIRRSAPSARRWRESSLGLPEPARQVRAGGSAPPAGNRARSARC